MADGPAPEQIQPAETVAVTSKTPDKSENPNLFLAEFHFSP